MKHLISAALLGLSLSLTAQIAHSEDLTLADVHIHYSHDAWEIFPPAEAIKILRSANLKHAFVSSSSDEGTQRLYQEAPDLIVRVLRPYTRRGQLGTWMNNPDILAHVKSRLNNFEYEGIGEFHVFGDNTDSEGVRGVVQLAKEYDLFLHAHSDAQAIHNLFEQNPDARILWAHSGFDDPQEIAELLRTYDSLWADLAFRSDHAPNGKVSPEWQTLFETFPDRIMVGTDTYTPERWPFVVEHARWSREWLNSLPRELAKNIAWRNAANLLSKKKR